MSASAHSYRAAFLSAAAVILLYTNGATGQQQPPGQVQEQSKAEVRDRSRKQAEDRLTLAALDEFIGQAQTSSEELGKLKAMAEALAGRMQELLTNDDGKRIGLDDSAHIQFVLLRAKLPMVAERAAAKKRTIDSLTATFKKQRELTQIGYVPPSSAKDLVEEARAWADASAKQLDLDRSWLDSVIAKIPAATDVTNARTLQKVIDDYREGKINAVTGARLAGERQAQPEGEKVVTTATFMAELERYRTEADNLLRETRAELDRTRSESEMTIARLMSEQSQRVADLETALASAQAERAKQGAQSEVVRQQGETEADKIRLRQRCFDPEVQRLLAPFISEGYWQPGDRFANQNGDLSPVSYSRIKSYGALRPTHEGRNALNKLGNHKYLATKHVDKVRPKWGYPSNFTKFTPQEMEELKYIQSLLIELGDTLVELKLLAP